MNIAYPLLLGKIPGVRGRCNLSVVDRIRNHFCRQNRMIEELQFEIKNPNLMLRDDI